MVQTHTFCTVGIKIGVSEARLLYLRACALDDDERLLHLYVDARLTQAQDRFRVRECGAGRFFWAPAGTGARGRVHDSSKRADIINKHRQINAGGDYRVRHSVLAPMRSRLGGLMLADDVVSQARQVKSDKRITLYVNGIAVGSGRVGSTITYDAHAAARISIGRSARKCDIVGPGVKGSLSQVALYQHPLSADRVAAHFRAAQPKDEANGGPYASAVHHAYQRVA